MIKFRNDIYFSGMKKIVITSLLVAASISTASAQTVTGRFELGNPDRAALSIPKEFSFDEVPYLIMYDSNDNNTIQVYNESLEVVRNISMKEEVPFHYQLTYEDETRDIIAVNEVGRSQFCRFDSYEAFVENEKNIDQSFRESWLIITDLGDGTKKVKVDYSNTRFTTNEQMYYAYDFFGMQYPKVYFVDSPDGFIGYKAMYAAQYSEWKISGTRTESHSKPQKRIRMCNINLNQGDGRANTYFEVSQTLFNEDDSFEYIMPKYKLSTSGNFPQHPIGGESESGLETTKSTLISEQNEIALAGFQVLSENGDVVSDITFDDGFEGVINNMDCAFLITIGNSRYLAFDGYCNSESSTIFFKIDNKNNNAIEKVKIAPSKMKVFPTIVSNGSTINVNLGDDNKDGSDIVVTSVSGAPVRKIRIPAGQSSAKISAHTSSGIYCISRIQQGRIAETQKIIVDD